MSRSITANVLQLNADFVLHKICDLGAVIVSRFALELETKNYEI